jgi:hypothetical protein
LGFPPAPLAAGKDLVFRIELDCRFIAFLGRRVHGLIQHLSNYSR